MSHIVGDSPPSHRFTPAAPALVRPRIGLEGAFFVFVLLLAAKAFLDLLGGLPYEGLVRFLWAGVYFVVVVLTLRRIGLRSLLILCRWCPAISIVLLLAVLSTTWSVAPAVTISRSISLVGSTLVGFYIGLRFSPPQLLRILSWAFALLILLSVAAATAVPGYGTMVFSSETFANTDAWKGISIHKNILGRIAAVSAIFFLIRLSTGDMSRSLGTALFCLSSLTVVMSDSMTALGMAASGIVMLAFCLLSSQLRISYSGMIILGVFGLVSMVGDLVLGWDLMLENVNRDQSLTGRTSIWNDALRLISDSPLLGFGFGAVWGFGTETLFRSYLTVPFVAHAHNGYLAVAVELGLPAAILSTGLVLAMVPRSFLASRTQISSYSLYVAAYMFMFFINNLIETGLFKQQDLFWIIFVSLSMPLVVTKKISSSRTRRERKRSRR